MIIGENKPMHEKYTGCFFLKVPPRKVLSMELVPLNRIKSLSTLVEHVVDDINNHKQGMVRRAVRKMKDKAQACVAVGGGVFEGRKL